MLVQFENLYSKFRPEEAAVQTKLIETQCFIFILLAMKFHQVKIESIHTFWQ